MGQAMREAARTVAMLSPHYIEASYA